MPQDNVEITLPVSMIKIKGTANSLLNAVIWGLTALMVLFASNSFAAEEYLEPEKAFQFSAEMVNPREIRVSFLIADKYYMYRERFAVSAQGAALGAPKLPDGKIKFDNTFQKNVETYRKEVIFTIPVEANGDFRLKVTSQGCADAGLCYAPMENLADLSPTGNSGLLAAARKALTGNDLQSEIDKPANSSIASTPSSLQKEPLQTRSAPDTESGRIDRALKSGRLLLIMPLFLLLGLGLAFTPCVLPMLPILSSIIVDEGASVDRRRALLLSVTYAIGMALVYTLLGITAGLIGEGLSAALQNPIVLSLFALVMVGLALSMFDLYQVQMPSALQQKLLSASDRHGKGKLVGVFIMGALSALIVGPCVAAPLAGALVYISQTRDVLIGGSALFAMAIGMSVPLLLIGASAGSLLPRTGSWMTQVKRFFGVLMLATAWWMMTPVLNAAIQMLGWAALGIGYGMFLISEKSAAWIARSVGTFFAVLGIVQLVGVASGGRDAMEPLAHLSAVQKAPLQFNRVTSLAELDATIARNPGKLVMLDFYADYCVSCKEMEKFTFTDPAVRARMQSMTLLQADVTANTAADKALLKRFNLFGPPGIIFFRNGAEIVDARVIGFQSSDQFLKSLLAAESN